MVEKLIRHSQNGNTIVSSGRELYHLQFSLQVASPETSGYTLIYWSTAITLNNNYKRGHVQCA